MDLASILNFLVIQGCSQNYGHSAICELAKQFYYDGKECLAVLFPDKLRTFLKSSLTMVCTTVSDFFYIVSSPQFLTNLQIICCLNKYKTGSRVNVDFTGDCYEDVFKTMSDTIDLVDAHDYHGQKLHDFLRSLASNGW